MPSFIMSLFLAKTVTLKLIVISRGIWACQKLSGGSVLDLSELQDPRTLGYLLIFGLYFKPIGYCYSLLLLSTVQRTEI